MAAIKFKKSKGIEKCFECGFQGIDLTLPRGRCGLQELVNFDITNDFALENRKGYSEIAEFASPIRATLSCGNKFYCLSGSTLSLTDTESGTTTELGNVGTSSGEGDIFFFCGELCVHDSHRLYRYDGSSLIEYEGYAPLYGVDWDPVSRGAVNEDINLVSNRLRIGFLTAQRQQTFDLGLEALSIDLIEFNGNEKTPEEMGASIDGTQITLTGLGTNVESGIPIVFWITLAESALKKNELSLPAISHVFSSNSGERLCLCFPGESNRIALSCAVTQSSVAESRRTDPDSLALYIPLSSLIPVGSGGYRVTGIAPHYDRALIFTDANTWCIDFEGDEGNADRPLPRIFLLNSSVGAETVKGGAFRQNDPVTYYRGGLFAWNSRSGELDECSAELISDKIAGLLPKDPESLSMLSVQDRGKLLIADGDDAVGKMLIYNIGSDSWSEYSGIFAERLFMYGTRPAFSRGAEIYLFDAGELDSESGESFAVKSKLVTGFTDFGTPELKKHSVSVVAGIRKCHRARFTFTNERGESRSFMLENAIGRITERLSLPCFYELSVKIEAEGAFRLENLIISAK